MHSAPRGIGFLFFVSRPFVINHQITRVFFVIVSIDFDAQLWYIYISIIKFNS